MLKLLIVDDQKGIRRLLTEVFLEYGYEIESCANGLQALEIIPKFQPDLVIMDVKMPGMNGIDVIKKLRESDDYKDIKVIMMTAYGDQHYISQAEALDVDKFIIKPFNLNELKKQVGEILKDKDFWIGS
ncbi:MAG TPA: response regulator [Peptococcaceae bacterium]|nr:response regulator [Peptococcaceae bacterium]